ncbi:MAG TPA: hypothetical protein VFO39_10555 [Candidatus Sulfotelmatobacter sp.]|nr:hypothetical protein [Candidatus Sulfotelmatobacter sp.]
MPHASIISDPVSQQTILLDHLKKEARIIPTPPAAAGSAPPGMPQAPAAAGQAPHMKVEDLGKSMIEGHEVEGKRYTLPAFTPPPKPPAPKADLPKMANAPQAPHGQKPSPPQAPQAPKLPNVPSVTELWTSTKLKIPVLTKVSTAAGQQTTYCKPTSTQEPPPSTFKIPPEYKIVPPNAPPSKVQIPKIQPPKIQAPKVQPPKLPKA